MDTELSTLELTVCVAAKYMRIEHDNTFNLEMLYNCYHQHTRRHSAAVAITRPYSKHAFAMVSSCSLRSLCQRLFDRISLHTRLWTICDPWKSSCLASESRLITSYHLWETASECSDLFRGLLRSTRRLLQGQMCLYPLDDGVRTGRNERKRVSC